MTTSDFEKPINCTTQNGDKVDLKIKIYFFQIYLYDLIFMSWLVPLVKAMQSALPPITKVSG